VLRHGSEARVFEIVEGQARARTIEAGATQAGQVVIKTGLTGQETLVARPAADLKDGDRVKIKS
jgi:hypothetical protein